jgi:outer membrane protein assembly factor BamB
VAYRDPSAVPVVSFLGNVLFAVEAETGQRLWTRPLERPVRRVAHAWRHVFVATHGPQADSSSQVLWFDIHTGEPRGGFDAGFVITAAVSRGTHVYFAGDRATIGLTADGSMLFRVALETTKQSWGGDEYAIVARDPSGRELWRAPAGAPNDTALLVGDVVAQPDIDT